MGDSIVPIFLNILALCLLIVAIVMLVLRRSTAYIAILGGSVLLLVISVVVEMKKRGEVNDVKQDMKVQAEILKSKTNGQFDIIIIAPTPNKCFIFNCRSYFIKLILKYQQQNDEKQVDVIVQKDPFSYSFNPENNNINMDMQPEMPGQSGVYNIPIHEVDLYGNNNKGNYYNDQRFTNAENNGLA